MIVVGGICVCMVVVFFVFFVFCFRFGLVFFFVLVLVLEPLLYVRVKYLDTSDKFAYIKVRSE